MQIALILTVAIWAFRDALGGANFWTGDARFTLDVQRKSGLGLKRDRQLPGQADGGLRDRQTGSGSGGD